MGFDGGLKISNFLKIPMINNNYLMIITEKMIVFIGYPMIFKVDSEAKFADKYLLNIEITDDISLLKKKVVL